MSATQVVGIMLVKNEDLFIERVLRNVLEFCDKIIVADDRSTDRTTEILKTLAAQHPKIEYHRLKTVRESHALVASYAGTPSWVFAVDGDEIYDPAGLAGFRRGLLDGRYDAWWQVFGNVLNCTALDVPGRTAKGHLAPPCRSMTKLYNFAAIESWGGECGERLHGGEIRFKPGYAADKRLSLHEQTDWDHSLFRCLHICFLRRSSRDPAFEGLSARMSPVDLQKGGPLDRVMRFVRRVLRRPNPSDWKLEKYTRGPEVSCEVSAFFPENER